MKTCEEVTVPIVLKLGTRWTWAVNCTPGTIYPKGTSPGTHWTEV
jgi:hypothetical protein